MQQIEPKVTLRVAQFHVKSPAVYTDTKQVLQSLLGRQHAGIEHPLLGFSGYQRKQKTRRSLFDYSQSKGELALNRILGSVPVQQDFSVGAK